MTERALSDRRVKVRQMASERRWKRRTRPRSSCDECGRDYADDPGLCKTVIIATHPLYSETICADCVLDLNITGYPTVLGTQTPPPGWPHPKPTAEQILEWLSNGGFRIPTETPLARIKVQQELVRVAERYVLADLDD